MSSRRHDLLLQFEGLAVASSILHFYSFIGFNFLISIRLLLLEEEGGRFSVLGLGLRAPERKRLLRFICTEFKRRERFMNGTHVSDSMRHRRESVSLISSYDCAPMELSI